MTGIILVDILAKEMNVLYHVEYLKGYTKRKNVARAESYYLWTHRGDKFTKGRCTHIHGQTSYHTGYDRCYRQNLHRFLDRSPNCPICGRMATVAEPVMFHCPKCTKEKKPERSAEERGTNEYSSETDLWCSLQCKTTKRPAEGSTKEESRKEQKYEWLKVNPTGKVIPKWWSHRSGAGEIESHTHPL